MVTIAICDDEKKVCSELESTILEIFCKMKLKCEIDIFYTTTEFCKKMIKEECYNLIFLDIVFAKEEINGVDVGRAIREARGNDAVSIVYISWEQKYSMQLFDIRPFNFLIKPLKPEKVEKIIKSYLKIASYHAKEFIYKIGHDTFKVQIKDIVYLKSYDRKLILHLVDGRKEEFYGSLKDVYSGQLKKFDFLFIHASYAVNYDYVATLKYEELILTENDITLPISQPKRKEVRETSAAIIERRKV